MKSRARMWSVPILVVISLGALASSSIAQTWIPLATSGGPPPQRKFESSVYDQLSNRLIVFGGCAAGTCQQGQGTLNDVWVLANADGLAGAPTWIQLIPTGGPPPPRHSHVAVYDPVSNRMVVWSGDSLFLSAPNLTDVWLLTDANGLDRATGQPATPQWIQLFPTGAAPQGGSNPGREMSAAVYDTSSNRMIVFGGASCDPCTIHNDVWALINANGLGGTPQWIQLFPTGGPPSPRIEHTVVYDGSADRMIVFGGGSTGAVNDTWVLMNASGVDRSSSSPVTPQWIQLTTSGGPPPARGFHAATYDSPTNRMVVFGGSSGFGIGPPGPTPFNDVWILTNANGVGAQTPTWSPLTPGGSPPSGRVVFHHRGLFNPSSNRMVIYGGASDLSATATTYQDSWVLSFGFLSFPLRGQGPETADISSVFDHSINIDAQAAPLFYKNEATVNGITLSGINGFVTAYTGEQGLEGCGLLNCLDVFPGAVKGYKNSDGLPFMINNHYTGDLWLFYDGHPGFDYPVPLGTEIVAPADGFLFVPQGDPITSRSQPAKAVEKFFIMAIDHGNGFSTWYLHVGRQPGTNGRSDPGEDFRLIQPGDPPRFVHRGEVIGRAGNRGVLPPRTSSAHLHFEVRRGVVDFRCELATCVPVDPYGWDGANADPYELTSVKNIRLWVQPRLP